MRAKLAEQLAQIFPQPVTEDDVEFVYAGLPRNPRNPMEGVMLRVNVGGDRRTERSEVMGSIAQFVLAAQGAGILAIDEPELHLHPSSQRSLARMLERGGAQCVISTHSADVVSAFDPDCVVTMRAGVAKQLRRGSLDDDARVRMRLWTHDRLEPLTARRIILVEGITDRLIVERVAQVTGRDLDRLGVSLVQTDGVGKMIPFDKVFGSEGFDVPIYRLIDSDAAQDAAERMHVPVSKLETRHVFVSQRDLEDEYVRGLGADVVWGALREGGLVALSVLKAWRAQWRAQARETAQHNVPRDASLPQGAWLGDPLPQGLQVRNLQVRGSQAQGSLPRDSRAHDLSQRDPQADDSLPQEPPTMEQVADAFGALSARLHHPAIRPADQLHRAPS